RKLAARATPSGHLDLAGVKVNRHRAVLTLAGTAAGSEGAAEPQRPAFEFVLPVPGAIEVPEAGLRISARAAGHATPDEISAGGDVAVLQARSVTLPLTARSRLPGD